MPNELTFSEHQRPADFSARQTRNVRGIGFKRAVRLRGRRLLGLAAAFAVPAVAAPGDWQRDWQAFSGGQTQQAQIAEAPQPMPFEQPGMNFPGSAFYYLEDAPTLMAELPALDPAVTFTETADDAQRAAALAPARAAGPAAAALFSAGTGIDKARARQCLAQAIYYEAASESVSGQRAVAQVVLNRVAHRAYPSSVCGVVYQGSQRSTGCQFSFTCDGSLRRTPSASGYARAQRLAGEALAGAVFAPVGLATHYHTNWVNPYWAPTLDHIGTIGAHRFYLMRGAAGRKGSYLTTYRGSEPLPRVGASLTPPPALSQISTPDRESELTRIYEDARTTAAASQTPGTRTVSAAPAYTPGIEARGGDDVFKANKLPQSGRVKEAYANSGKWITDPAKSGQ